MELVDDDDVEVVGSIGSTPAGVEALDRREDVLEARGPLAADPELAEGRVPERVAERRPALVEDLLAVRDEQQPVRGERRAQARVVDRGHDRLARAGRRDEQVPVVALRRREGHLFEQPFLERAQHDLDRAQQRPGPRSASDVRCAELLGVVRDEVAAVPVAVKTAAILATTSGLRAPETRTFHSSP